MTESHVPFETLHAHRAWVRVLVRRMVADDASAADLEQETWLAALRRPPRHGTALRAWFARVVRSRAVSQHRADSRRVAREEAVARPGVSPATADLVARAELEQRVVQAVLGLPDPYREALLLRYYEELPPRAVAERLGVPVETARTRIWRGVARLRTELEGSKAGDLRRVFAPLLGAPAAHGLSWKGALMGSAKKACTAAAIAVAVGAALWGAAALMAGGRGRTPTDTATGVHEGSQRRHADTGDDDADSHAVGGSEGAGVAAPVAAPAASALTVTFREAETQRPAAGVDVVLVNEDGRVLTGRSAATGTLAFRKLAPGRGYSLTASRSGSATVRRNGLTLPHGAVLSLGTVWISAPLTLDVTVVDTAGRPVPGAQIEVHETVDAADLTWGWRMREFINRRDTVGTLAEPIATAETRAEGVATIEGIPAGEYRVLATAVGRGRGVVRGVRVVAGAPARPTQVVLLPAHRLRGRVVDQTGTAIAGAEVIVRRPDDWDSPGDRLITSADVWSAESAEDGVFEVRDAPEGILWITVRTELGVTDGGRVIVPASGERTVVVPRGSITLAGHVRDQDGQPIAGARLTLSANLVARDGYIDPPTSFRRSAVSGDDGSYEIRELPPAESIELRVEAAGFRVPDRWHQRDAPPLHSGVDGVVTHDIVLPRGLVATVQIVDETGAPVPGAPFALHHVGRGWPPPAPARGVTGPDGIARVGGLDDDAYVVIVDVPGFLQPDLPPDAEDLAEARGTLPQHALVTAGAATAHVVRIAPGATVRGLVQDAAGTPLKGATVRLQGSEMVAATDSEGLFVLRGLRPTFRGVVEARLGASAPAVSRPLALTAGETTDAGALRVSAGRTVAGTVRSSSGMRLEGATVRVVSGEAPRIGEQGAGYYAFPALSVLSLAPRRPVASDGSFTVDSLAPGIVTVVAEASGHAINWSAAVDVSTGDQRNVEIVLTPGQRIAGTVRIADGTPASGVQVEALLDGTRAAFGLPVPSAVTGPFGTFELTGLHARSYELLVRGPAVVPFLVDSVRGGEPDVAITVERAVAIRGVVLDESGRGLDGVRLILQGRRAMDPKPNVRTDRDGRFELAGVAAGSHSVRVIPPKGYVMVESAHELPAGAADVTLRARRVPGSPDSADDDSQVALTVRLLLPDGTALEEDGPAVDISSRPAGSTGEWNSGGSSLSTSEGSVGLEERMPGRYDMKIEVEGFLPVYRQNVEAGTVGAVVRLDRGASMSGIVVDEGGRPVGDAWVTSEGDSEVPGGPTAQRVTTEDDGRFELTGLERGAQRVTVTHDHHAWAGVALPGPQPDGVRIVLTAGVALEGRVIDADGAPLGNVRVVATNRFGGSMAHSVQTAPNGTFRIPRLARDEPVRMRIRAPGSGQAGEWFVHPEPVTPGGERVEITTPW